MTSKKQKVLIIPGLNQSREIYQSFFSNSNLETHFFEFTKNLDDFKSSRLCDYSNRLEIFLLENSFDIVVSHSLGGLLFAEFLCLHANYLNNKKAILIAPALTSKLIAHAFFLLPDFFKVKSFNREKFRNHDYCFAFLYKDLLKKQKAFDIIKFSKIKNIICYFDPRDELLGTYLFYQLGFAKEFLCRDRPVHLYLDLVEKLGLDPDWK